MASIIATWDPDPILIGVLDPNPDLNSILSRGSVSVRKYLRIWNTAHEFAPNAFYTKLSLSYPKGSLSTVHFPYLFQKGPCLLHIFLIFSKSGPIYCTLSLSFPKGSLSTVNFPYLFQKGPYLL
jgi:hypothetical protein